MCNICLFLQRGGKTLSQSVLGFQLGLSYKNTLTKSKTCINVCSAHHVGEI